MKRKIWNIVGAVLLLLLAAAESLLLYRVLRLNMLPDLYVWILAGVLLLVAAAMGLFLIPLKEQKGRLPRRILSAVLAVIIIAACLWGSDALGKVQNTMDAVTDQTEISDIVGIYVPADDPAQTLEDARDYVFAVTEVFDWENTQKTLEALGQPKTLVCESVPAMLAALWDGSADAMVLNTAYLTVLEDIEGYQNIHDQLRLLYEHTLRQVIPAEPPKAEVPEQAEPQEQVPEEEDTVTPFVLYISGSDSRSPILTNRSRNDVNILAAVNPKTRQVLLVNTPRDYYVANPAGNGGLDKLTHCGIYGTENSMETLSQLYGIPVDYNARVNFGGFETLVDAVGGVTVYSPVSFGPRKGYYFSAGENTLNGEAALCFARERYAMPGGDNDRGKNQMRLVKAIAEKLMSSTLLTRYTQILDSMQTTFSTSVPQEMISELVKMQLTDMSGWDIHSFAVTGWGSSQRTYSAPGSYAYVMYPNEETVAQAKELMDRVLQGQILTAQDLVIE